MTLKSHLKHTLAATSWQMLRLCGRQSHIPRVVVIMYHSVGGNALMSLDPVIFNEHMELLRERFSKIITIHELALTTDQIIEWTACITFDDGFSDNYDIVLPILHRHGLSATFFICSGFVEGEYDITKHSQHYYGLRPLGWNQIRELASERMEIGAHTHSHPLLANLPTRLQCEEIYHSKCLIEAKLSQAVHSFAIPFGNRGTYTHETLDLAARQFQACCTTHFSTNPSLLRRHKNMLLLDRIAPLPNESIKTFENQLLGHWDAMKWLQRSRYSSPRIEVGTATRAIE